MATKTPSRSAKSDRPAWVNYLEDRCNRTMYGDTHIRWQKWMSEPPPEGLGECPSDETLLEVLRWVRSKRDTPSSITVDVLMGWFRWYKKEHSIWNNSNGATPEPEHCEMCEGVGVVRVAPYLKSPYTADELWRAYTFTGPCRCSHGQEQERYQARLSDEHWIMACEQNKVRNCQQEAVA